MHEEYIDPEKKRTSLLRIALIVISLIIICVVILLLTKGCSGQKDLYMPLVNATKDYYKLDGNTYPQSKGECNSVKLSELEKNNLIANLKLYSSYDNDSTYVKVCKLESGDYQFTPVLQGGEKNTIFSDWDVGTEDDLVQNSSDVDFKFIGEIGKNGIKNYYPDNNSNENKVSQYYADVPDEQYIYKDSPDVAYKWYVVKQVKKYYNDGEYSSTQPEGYTTQEDEKSKSYLSVDNPKSATYRVANKTTLYATETMAYPYLYVCTDSNKKGAVISPTLCENRSQSDFKKTSALKYTCDGKTEVEVGTVCSNKTNWTTTSCKAGSQTKTGTTDDGYSYTQQVSTGKRCIMTDGYSVTDKVWKWYKLENANVYYPSEETDASREKTYYVNTPTAGAIKDDSTKTTAYKYYKLIDTESTDQISWVSISDKSMNSSDLINKFKELGYEVNSLSDIENNEKIRYQLELSYRKRK